MATRRKNWDDGVRCTILTLWTTGSKTLEEIQEQYSMSPNTLYGIQRRALSRGWVKGSPVLLEHVQQTPRSSKSTRLLHLEAFTNFILPLGRPEKLVNPTDPTLSDEIIKIISKNKRTRE